MDTSQSRTRHVFVVEMWCEGASAPAPSWRGVIKHVAHGEQRYFVDLGDLTQFLTMRLQAEPSPDSERS